MGIVISEENWLVANVQHGFETHVLSSSQAFDLLLTHFDAQRRWLKAYSKQWQAFMLAVFDLAEQCDLYSPHYATYDDMVALFAKVPSK